MRMCRLAAGYLLTCDEAAEQVGVQLQASRLGLMDSIEAAWLPVYSRTHASKNECSYAVHAFLLVAIGLLLLAAAVGGVSQCKVVLATAPRLL